MVITESVIPKWFRHQSMGAEVNINEPSHLFTNGWMGIAVCAIFCSLPHHKIPHYKINGYCGLCCHLIVNGNEMPAITRFATKVGSSDNIWLLYLLKQYFKEGIKLLKECEANEFSQIGIKIEVDSDTEVKKCGFRMVYKKDLEDLNQTMA